MFEKIDNILSKLLSLILVILFTIIVAKWREWRGRLAFWCARRRKCALFAPLPREEVYEVFKKSRELFYKTRNKCRYVAAYLSLIYARLLGKLEYEAMLNELRGVLPRDCAAVKHDEECMLVNYLVAGRVNKEMRFLAKNSNIYGEIAKYMLGGVFPQDCLEDLKGLVEVIPEKHRQILKIFAPTRSETS